MIAEEKRKEILAAIEQVQDEEAFEKIATLVKDLLAPKPAPGPGFLHGSVQYLVDDWDAPLPDAAWAHDADE